MLYFHLFSSKFNCTVPLITAIGFSCIIETWWFLIRWLIWKAADLNLQCFQNRINPGSAGQGLTVQIHSVPYGPCREKTCLRWFANNKDADQPVYPRTPISAFVFRVLESIISKRAKR